MTDVGSVYGSALYTLAREEDLSASVLEELTALGIQPGDAAGSPEEILLRKQQIFQVRQQVAQLPDTYRIPLQLYYSAGLAVSGIAEVLKLPENTVKSRLHRAKKMIRTQLEEMEYGRPGI